MCVPPTVTIDSDDYGNNAYCADHESECSFDYFSCSDTCYTEERREDQIANEYDYYCLAECESGNDTCVQECTDELVNRDNEYYEERIACVQAQGDTCLVQLTAVSKPILFNFQLLQCVVDM